MSNALIINPLPNIQKDARNHKTELDRPLSALPSPTRGGALRLIMTLLWFWTHAALSLAQEAGTVSGQVVSTWDGTALPSVVVTVRGTTLATRTDANGRFELKNVPLGDQVLRFSKSGFASAVVTDVRVLAGQIHNRQWKPAPGIL